MTRLRAVTSISLSVAGSGAAAVGVAALDQGAELLDRCCACAAHPRLRSRRTFVLTISLLGGFVVGHGWFSILRSYPSLGSWGLRRKAAPEVRPGSSGRFIAIGAPRCRTSQPPSSRRRWRARLASSLVGYSRITRGAGRRPGRARRARGGSSPSSAWRSATLSLRGYSLSTALEGVDRLPEARAAEVALADPVGGVVGEVGVREVREVLLEPGGSRGRSCRAGSRCRPPGRAPWDRPRPAGAGAAGRGAAARWGRGPGGQLGGLEAGQLAERLQLLVGGRDLLRELREAVVGVLELAWSSLDLARELVELDAACRRRSGAARLRLPAALEAAGPRPRSCSAPASGAAAPAAGCRRAASAIASMSWVETHAGGESRRETSRPRAAGAAQHAATHQPTLARPVIDAGGAAAVLRPAALVAAVQTGRSSP